MAATTWTVDRAGTYEIARLTGRGSINHTDGWSVHGTDLGHMFAHRGLLYLLFGDTYGRFRGRWRSNTMAYARDQDPARGIVFEGMVTDRYGRARELVSRRQVSRRAVTVIPTYGLSLGDRMMLHYMAVRKWGRTDGRWTLDRSGLAYSDDDGATWEVSAVAWPGDSNFGQVAFVQSEGFVYLLGIPGGRFGGVRLARVRPGSVLDGAAYTYWTGAAWAGEAERAAEIVEAPVGELSVRWNAHYGTWLMTYLSEAAHAVVLRTAGSLTGPWSAPQRVVTTAEVPRLYAPYLPPWWNDRPDIFFTLSRFDRYNVSWWRTALV